MSYLPTELESLAAVYLSATQEADALAEKMRELKAQKDRASAQAEEAQKAISDRMKEQEYVTDRYTIKYRVSHSVDITDMDLIPDIFKEVTYKADKVAIKSALLTMQVPGAQIVTNHSLNISKNG